jgi:hypothetical protein
MMYAKQLPKIYSLKLLAKQTKNFPITGLGIAQYAEHLGYDEGVVDFIKLFSGEMVFNSRTDFLEHCSLLERLLREERQTIPEHLRSPQG